MMDSNGHFQTRCLCWRIGLKKRHGVWELTVNYGISSAVSGDSDEEYSNPNNILILVLQLSCRTCAELAMLSTFDGDFQDETMSRSSFNCHCVFPIILGCLDEME